MSSELSPEALPKLVVSISRQELTLHLPGGTEQRRYPVSTSKFGVGFEEGSFKTPTGHFRIGARYGEGAAEGTIFKGRRPVGVYSQTDRSDEDLVLTRILWLEGLEAANANTRERYIYFHGTNQEHLVGSPASMGCIRLRNSDMVDLFDHCPEGSPVEITEL